MDSSYTYQFRMKAFLCLAYVILSSSASCYAEITSSPGLQRVRIGETCNFRWTVNGSMGVYKISNQTSGNSLRNGTMSSYDESTGVIILTILNVQLWDAGNYSLVINGQSSNVDNSACLFVYGTPIVSIYLSSGKNPATEGDAVELNCSISSTSLPVAFRPKMYNYWKIQYIGSLKNISSGPATLDDGNLVPGYSIKNDGRTLVIDSVKYPNDSLFQCEASEDKDEFYVTRSTYSYSTEYKLSMRYKPYIDDLSPSSRRLTAIVGTEVFLSFNSDAVPPINSMTNWSFTDNAGNTKNLPLYSVTQYSFSNTSLRFNFTSKDYYGKYAINLTNDLGSTTVDFQIFPAGPPDIPSKVQLVYVSHFSISVKWNVMFANSIDNYQTVFVRVVSQDTGRAIDTKDQSFSSNVYNVTYNTFFQENIEPKSNYEVRIWSVNVYGHSDVATLSVRTRSQPKLNVCSETISISGHQATVNFTVIAGNDTENMTVAVSFESAPSGIYASSSIEGKVGPNQIVIDGLSSGTDYFCDLYVYCGVYMSYDYFGAVVRGIKVSRNGNNESTDQLKENLLVECGTTDAWKDENSRSFFIAMIVLAVLLGVAVLALVGILIAFLCKKFRG